MLRLFTAALSLSVAFGCNTEAELAADMAAGGSQSHGGQGGLDREIEQSSPLTLLPQDKGNESPACLDGSPYGFYFQPSKTGSTKWTISIEGGGWCYDEQDCYGRSKMALGSSKGWSKTGGCGCMNTKGDGTGPGGIDEDCNCLYMPYGDGASFSGYRPDPWPVPGTKTAENPEGETLTFRGIKNIDATVDWAMKNGLTKATEFVLTGGSAGGLSTFLHADRVAARLEAEAPDCKLIRAAPVVGYFLDHGNFKNTTGQPNTPNWHQATYTTWMKYIYKMQNLTFGSDGGLTAACKAKHPDAPGLCFMSPHMQDVIKTPFFMFNSKYDAWQLGSEFQSNWATKAEQDGVLQYGKDFMTQLAPVYTGGETKNGGMITSCICHGCPWGTLSVEGKTSYQHYAAWMAGKTTGVASMHIDTRTPNGGGSLTGKNWAQCKPFPAAQQEDRGLL